MTRSLFVLLLACTVVSCGGDGVTGLSAAKLAGQWRLQYPANATCAGAAAAGNRYFEIEADGYSDGVLNVVSEWDVVTPHRGFDWLLTGNFNLEERTVELNFWHTPLVVGSQFLGTIADDGTISGTLRDPKPGYDPHFVLGTCVFSPATGTLLP